MTEKEAVCVLEEQLNLYRRFQRAWNGSNWTPGPGTVGNAGLFAQRYQRTADAIELAISAICTAAAGANLHETYTDVATSCALLTPEQLKGMGGQPVWIVEHPDWGHWELSEDGEDYIADRDPELYGLRHDDPEGKNGLHKLGWVAYAYPLAHIDREAWEPCEWCGSVGGKPDNWVCSLEDDNGYTVTNNHMVVCATANYCPVCGRPLTPEAWTELEKRLRG